MFPERSRPFEKQIFEKIFDFCGTDEKGHEGGHIMERWHGKIEIRATAEVTSGVHVAKIPPVARCDKTRGVTRERKAACNRAITSIQRVQPGNYSATALLSSPGIPSSVSIRLETPIPLFDRLFLHLQQRNEEKTVARIETVFDRWAKGNVVIKFWRKIRSC